jgi:surface antigen
MTTTLRSTNANLTASIRPRVRTRIRRRVAAAALTLAAAAGGGAVLATAPAGATTGYGPYLTVATLPLAERVAPSASAAAVGSLAYHSTIFITCQTSGSLVENKSSVWDRLTNGDFVADYWTNTPAIDTFTTSIPRCATPPTTTPPTTTPAPAPKVKIGRTVSYNQGTAGQCTWWAINEFHHFSGRYPNFTKPGNDGNAEYWAGNAAYDGWTVTSTPRVDSVVVFPPGVNGALSDGHVAWVTRVSGAKITFTEMNATAGAGNVDTRTVTPAGSVRYILAPQP